MSEDQKEATEAEAPKEAETTTETSTEEKTEEVAADGEKAAEDQAAS